MLGSAMAFGFGIGFSLGYSCSCFWGRSKLGWVCGRVGGGVWGK